MKEKKGHWKRDRSNKEKEVMVDKYVTNKQERRGDVDRDSQKSSRVMEGGR